MDSPRIDEIARRLLESVPPRVRALQQDLESNFRAVLRSSLTKLDLVSRDEFDAQVRVLERTRARLEELERLVAQMERGAGVGAVGPANESGGGAVGARAAEPASDSGGDPVGGSGAH
jgi:BMFP domain-containing protein YqiC